MAFMIPEYASERFTEFVDEFGDTWFTPTEDFSRDMGEVTGEYTDKWFCRLTAPGYLDCTDWVGPFNTLEGAQEHIEELWEIDPDTGEDLEYD